MFRFTLRSLFVVLSLVAGLSVAGSAWAQSVPHMESSSGQIFNVTATQFEWVAEGQGTHFGSYSESGITRYYADGTCEGEFTVTAADGSTIGGIFYGTLFDLGGGYTGFDVTVEWLAGTGRLEGVSGIGSATAAVENATGKAEITASGTWEKP
jgi:hypothetical protein